MKPLAAIKKLSLVVVLLINSVNLVSQQNIDSLKNNLKSFKGDTMNAGYVSSLNNIGANYKLKGDVSNALYFHLKALKISEIIKDNNCISTSLYKIGKVHFVQENFTEALNYYNKAKSIKDNQNDTVSDFYIQVLNNITSALIGLNKYDEALKISFKCLSISQTINYVHGISECNFNLGNIYFLKNDFNQSLKYYLVSLTSAKKEKNNQEFISYVYTNLGEVSMKLKEYKSAHDYYTKSLNTALQLGDKETIKFNYIGLSDLDSIQGNYISSMQEYKLSVAYSDSLKNEENTKNITRQEMNFEFNKKETELKAKQQANEIISNEEKKRQRVIIYAVAGVLILVVIFSMFLYKRFKVAQKQKHIIGLQKDEVSKQKHLVEEHQKEIIDSINYAKRLQQAILPPTSYIKQYLTDSFVLYNPKDIVAGDFYWMESLDGFTFIAVADSTGHGIPAAMVSIVCSNSLNRAVKEFGLRETGTILDKTRELVLETFAKSEETINDGMDISILRIDNSGKSQTQWSGANNQLWYIKNNTSVMLEVKADKQPIGKTDYAKPFTTHTLELEKGDMVYLMTDGFPDQFGGEKSKKFKYKQLEELLVSIKSIELSEQKNILSETFNNWKGSLEQTDDVTLMGIKL
jgi:serine phosphatase RsbU (regulator of sigma subunit)